MFIVCDQGSQESFNDITDHWLKEAREHSDPGTQLVLILNKMDIAEKQLDPQQVASFAEREGLLMYETSAKTGKNVNGVFTEVCKALIKKK